jgi:hypothetical protein
MSITVTIDTMSGMEHEVNVSPESATVKDLKEIVQKASGETKSCDSMILIFSNDVLTDDDATLASLGISDLARLTLSWKREWQRKDRTAIRSEAVVVSDYNFNVSVNTARARCEAEGWAGFVYEERWEPADWRGDSGHTSYSVSYIADASHLSTNIIENAGGSDLTGILGCSSISTCTLYYLA